MYIAAELPQATPLSALVISDTKARGHRGINKTILLVFKHTKTLWSTLLECCGFVHHNILGWDTVHTGTYGYTAEG